MHPGFVAMKEMADILKIHEMTLRRYVKKNNYRGVFQVGNRYRFNTDMFLENFTRPLRNFEYEIEDAKKRKDSPN